MIRALSKTPRTRRSSANAGVAEGDVEAESFDCGLGPFKVTGGLDLEVVDDS